MAIHGGGLGTSPDRYREIAQLLDGLPAGRGAAVAVPFEAGTKQVANI